MRYTDVSFIRSDVYDAWKLDNGFKDTADCQECGSTVAEWNWCEDEDKCIPCIMQNHE